MEIPKSMKSWFLLLPGLPCSGTQLAFCFYVKGFLDLPKNKIKQKKKTKKKTLIQDVSPFWHIISNTFKNIFILQYSMWILYTSDDFLTQPPKPNIKSYIGEFTKSK